MCFQYLPKRKGIDLLKQELIQRAKANHESPNNQHFRMAIDRVFSLKGWDWLSLAW